MKQQCIHHSKPVNECGLGTFDDENSVKMLVLKIFRTPNFVQLVDYIHCSFLYDLGTNLFG